LSLLGGFGLHSAMRKVVFLGLGQQAFRWVTYERLDGPSNFSLHAQGIIPDGQPFFKDHRIRPLMGSKTYEVGLKKMGRRAGGRSPAALRMTWNLRGSRSQHDGGARVALDSPSRRHARANRSIP